MKVFRVILAMIVLLAPSAYAYKSDLDVATIAVYKNKSMIPADIIGNAGSGIPDGVPLVVMKVSNSTYEHWTFVAYGDSMDQMLSLWLSAKAIGKPVTCVAADRGNYWVECTGTWLQ